MAALDEELLRNLLIRHNDELIFNCLRIVDRTKLVCPFLKFEPEVEPGQVVDAANEGKLPGSWKLGLGFAAILPGEHFLDC